MKKKLFISSIILLGLFLVSASVVSAVSSQEKIEIQERIKVIQEAINSGKIQEIVDLVSPNAFPELKDEILVELGGKSIQFQEEISTYEDLAEGKVKVKGRFTAKGMNWSVSGLGNYFIFEKVGDEWLLLETDFYQKLNPAFVLKIIKKIFVFGSPIFAFMFIFWIWMLIDCAKKPVKDKVAWVLIIVFAGIIGAIVYFFIERRKYKNL